MLFSSSLHGQLPVERPSLERKRPPVGCEDPFFSLDNYPCCIVTSFCLPEDDTPSVTWDFGDGSPQVTSDQPVEHCYCEAGTYDVSLSSGGYTLTQQAIITEPCIDPSFSVELFDYAGCQEPFICSEVCDEVTLKLTDTSTSILDEEEITDVEWFVRVFKSGVLDYTLQDTGEEVFFTFYEWHAGIKIEVEHTVITCLGEVPNQGIIKADCLQSNGEGSSYSMQSSDNNINTISQHGHLDFITNNHSHEHKEVDFADLNIEALHSDGQIQLVAEGLRRGTFELLNMNGQVLSSQQLQSPVHLLDIGNISSGIYVIRVVDTERAMVETRKILIR